jgi:hypothetical protein
MSPGPREPRTADAGEKAEVEALLQLFFFTQTRPPTKGAAQWAFFTRELPRSLTKEEARARLESGKGFRVLELVWDRELTLVQRGPGHVVRSLEDLWRVAEERVRPIFLGAGQGGRDVFVR